MSSHLLNIWLVLASAMPQLGIAIRDFEVKQNAAIAFQHWDTSEHPKTLLTRKEISEDLNRAIHESKPMDENHADRVCKSLKEHSDAERYDVELNPVYFQCFETKVISFVNDACHCTFTKGEDKKVVLGIANLGDGEYLLSRYFKGKLLIPALRDHAQREGFAYFGTIKLDAEPPRPR